MDEQAKPYSKIGWCLIAAVLICIYLFLPVILVEIGPSLIIIEFISAFVILGISGWYLLRDHE